MTAAPFALSVHTLLNSAGADAGFAAILGLAIVVLLFFAQSRETATLRANLKRASEQLESLEARLQAVARAQATAAQAAAGRQPARPPFVARPIGAAASLRLPTKVAAPATRALGGPLPGLPPAAPAGVGAPALSGATRLIPSPTPTPTVRIAAGGAASTDDETAIVGPAPATFAGNGDGAARGPHQEGPVPPRVSMRHGAPAGPSTQRGFAPGASKPRRLATHRSLGARLAPWLIGVAALGVAVAAILVATGGPTSTTPTARNASAAKGRHDHLKAATFRPASVTVAVLNGTDVAKLAENTGRRLAAMGYKEGTIHNAPTQTHAATIVAYLSGHASDALKVARALSLGTSAVQAVDPGTLAVACPQPGPCTADVVVTIGQDLASSAGSTPTTTT
ncbi:MAG: LytR C-terminal domain-containing protein [Solirubrobacteraceae bacterium]